MNHLRMNTTTLYRAIRNALCSGALAATFGLAVSTAALAQNGDIATFDIVEQPLPTALKLFAEQAGMQLLYRQESVRGLTVQTVRGQLDKRQALLQLLSDTGLEVVYSASNAATIRPRSKEPAAKEGNTNRTPAGIESDNQDPSEVGPMEDRRAVPLGPTGVTEIGTVVVTGTLIRGAGDGPSPVVSITRDQMDEEGRSTVAQVLANLPQNFGGTANEATVNIGDRSGTNSTYASGVNLRGLGSDATLVLINGRRMAGTGAKGDFADLSTIPTIAVERIEVLLDGASALYGTDAVGGVVNIILRPDYEGSETRVRVGNTWDGASGEYQFGQAFGRSWSSGNALIAYEYHDRQELAASERRRAGDSDLRWLGGTDQRSFYSNPGNIVLNDPATGNARPAYAIPTDQAGLGLQPADFVAGEVNLENQRSGLNVIPHQTRHGLYAMTRQEIGDRFQLGADVRLGKREYETVSGPISTLLTVNTNNPYFVSPTGARSHNIAYSFGRELSAPQIFGRVESFGSSVGGEARLHGDWILDAYVAYASEESRTGSSGSLHSTRLREALGTVADNPLTSYSPSRDGYLNPFGDGAVNNSAVLDFISSGFNRTHFRMEVASANVQASGTLMALPGGPAKLAVGLSLRDETFKRQNTGFTSGLEPNVGTPFEADRDVFAAFAEARLPIFGHNNKRAWFERLDLSVAARLENYGDVGKTVSPKIGALWEPIESLLIRANYGRSFRAPALRELHDAASASPSILPRGNDQILSMILYGGNPDIEPEEADSWTAGFEYRPSSVPGMRLWANVFQINFDNRIGQPALESILTALSDPSLAPFVRTLDPANNADDRAAIQAILDLPTTGLRDLFPATDYGVIVDARYVNTASVEVRGADITASYGFDVGSSTFDLGLNMTWLERFDARATPASETVSQVDIPNFPNSIRGRSTASWSRGDWTVLGALNYVDSYHDLLGKRIASWATTDLTVRYAPMAGGFDGVTIVLNAQNIFDRDPPFYDSPYGVAYDPVNTNVLGRFVSLQFIKAW